MTSTQSRKKRSLFLPIVLTVLSASVYLTVACGGDTPGAKTPGGGSEGTSSGGASGAAGSGAAGGAGGDGASSGGAGGAAATPGTTTTALPPGGELQGAKLGSSSHTEVETKGDAGPKAGAGHSQEPGRKREDIQARVQSQRDDARACYDKGLKDHPGIEGDLTVKFLIDPTGAVTEASVDTSKSTINEPTVGNCIVDIIKKIKFPASKGGFETRANYPFNFHPKTFGKGDGGAAK